jgi:C4-dicarboxylate-specific signal transduction histidine kinase
MVNVTLKLEEGLPCVTANRTQIQKVLLNLVNNGIEAMQAAGVNSDKLDVVISTAKNESFILMTIQDAGPGIRKEDINRIFDPFFTTKKEGIGMGLAISRSLIEENGGQLWLDQNTNPGATFHLTLPFEI